LLPHITQYIRRKIIPKIRMAKLVRDSTNRLGIRHTETVQSAPGAREKSRDILLMQLPSDVRHDPDSELSCYLVELRLQARSHHLPLLAQAACAWRHIAPAPRSLPDQDESGGLSAWIRDDPRLSLSELP